MNRREFLKAAALASMTYALPFQGWAAQGQSNTNKKLIVIMLRGAVDGLNVCVPVGNSQYYSIRPNIALSKPGQGGGALNLDGHFALNPALSPLMDMWNNKRLSFIHSAGSPDPSRSHFDAQDYMESGEPGVKSISTGWLN